MELNPIAILIGVSGGIILFLYLDYKASRWIRDCLDVKKRDREHTQYLKECRQKHMEWVYSEWEKGKLIWKEESKPKIK